MPRATVLSAFVLGLLVLTGCWPVAQSQPPASTATPVSVVTPASATAAAPKPAASAASPSVKPTAVTAKPTASPAVQAATSPAASTNGAASAKPAVQPSPTTGATNGGPAVVATSVAGLPAVGASPTPADTLGVAASAGSAAAANVSDSDAVALCGPGAILSTRAGQAVGRQATVAIAKVAVSYQPNVRGQPTFLNDAPFPNHVFTAVIWGSERRQFQPPPEEWQGKSLCVTGPVELFQQRPQIVVSSPSQLRAGR